MLNRIMQSLAEQFLSIANFQQAWLKVSKKNGCAGTDGETIAQFRQNLELNLATLINAIASGNYQPAPYKQILIPKDGGRWRELRVPSVRDRVAQQALLNILSPIIEPRFSVCSFAYRPSLSYIQAVEKIAHWRDIGYQWVLDGDITRFFDNINRNRLLIELRKYIEHSGIAHLINAWISGGTQTNKGLFKTTKGIPQGAVISPLLANIYLHEFDRKFERSDLQLVRYADDFLVLAKSQNRIKRAYVEVATFLQAIALELHPQKTRITNFVQGFQFLGHRFIKREIYPVDKHQESKWQQKSAMNGKNSDLAKILAQEESGFSSSTKNSAKLGKSKERDLQNNLWQAEMATIYLLEPGTSIYKQYQRFILHVPNKNKLEIPIKEVERILVFGKINLSTPVINTCLQLQIAVLFLSTTAQYQGHLWSAEATDFRAETLQLNRKQDRQFQLSISKAIVFGKMMNSKQLLLRFNLFGLNSPPLCGVKYKDE